MSPAQPSRPFTIALTGGIGSGKSAVAHHFACRGIEVVDADQLAREVVAPGSDGFSAVVDAFGGDVVGVDGCLNRAVLRQRVFADESERARLNALLHPRIAAITRERLASADSPYVIWMVPLLVENRLWTQADRVLVVDLPEILQRQRAAERDGVSTAQIDAIMAAQASRQARLAIANDIIDNRDPPAALCPQVAALHLRYLLLAANRTG